MRLKIAPSKNVFSKLLSLKNMHNKKRSSLMSIKKNFFFTKYAKTCGDFLQIKVKKFYNKKVKKFFFSNLGICRVITCFTTCLCITKKKKFSAFCMNCIEVFNTFFN